MIMNIRSQQPQVSRLPEEPLSDSNIFDPRSVEAMANELYGAVPGRSSVANQVNQAQAAGEATTMPQPASPQTPTLPLQYSPAVAAPTTMPQTEAGAESPSPSVPGVTAVEKPAESDALSAIAQQLYAQMSSASLDPAMQQAVAGLDSAAFAPAPVSQFPGTSAPSETPSPKSETRSKTAQPSFYFFSPPAGENLGLMPQPEAGTEIPSPSVPGVTEGGTTAESDAPSAIAQHLYAQMSSASLDPNLQQAVAKGAPSVSGAGTGALPLHSAAFAPAVEDTRSDLAPEFPGTSAPGETLSREALDEVVQQLSAQIAPIFPKENLSQPTPLAGVAAVETPSPKSETRSETAQPAFYFLSPPVGEKAGLESVSTPAVENVDLELGEPFDVQVIRQDFPILQQKVNGKPLIWMDNAATTQKPQSVIDTLSRFYERDNSNIHRGAHTLAARATDAYEAARETVQRFLGAGSASEIIFARGTTEAINLVAQTYGRKYIREGDEIILSTLEHHSNIVPWQMLAQETGASLKVIPVSDSGEILLEEYARLLGPRTRLVAVTHVSNALGTILPVREITEMAHRHNARVLIDGAQGVPHLPVNVQALDCDFYTFSGHKLFAPAGIGVLYGKREILEDMPPWQGGGSMIRSVTFEHTTYEEPPAKFEAGTPSIADAVGLGAAIDYLNRIGLVNIEQYERKLTCYATERLAQIPGLRLIGTAPHKVSVLSFLLDDLPPEEVGKRLDREGIAVRAGHHCAQPTMQRYGITGTVRPSLAFYNTCSEIDTLVEVLRTMRFR